MVNLEELMLREEDRIDVKVTDVVSNHEEDKGEEDDDVKILETRLQESKRAQVK